MCLALLLGTFLIASPASAQIPGELPKLAGTQTATASAVENDTGGAKPERESVEGVRRLVRFLGKLHPLAVHFPIALVLIAFGAEVVHRLRNGETSAQISRFCILAGAAAAVLTAPLGWAASGYVSLPEDLEKILWFHAFLGTAAAVVVALAAFVTEMARKKIKGPAQRDSVIFLALGAALIVLASHTGAILVHGPGYFSW